MANYFTTREFYYLHRRKLRILVAVIAIGLLIGSAAWFVVAGNLKDQVTGYLAHPQKGFNAKTGEVTVTGFPFAFNITIPDANIATPDAMVTFPVFTVKTSLLTPNIIHYNAERGLIAAVVQDGQTHNIGFSSVNGSITATTEGDKPVTLSDTRATGMRFYSTDPSLPRFSDVDLSLNFSIAGNLPQEMTEIRMAAWQQTGGEINLHDFTVSSDILSFGASGHGNLTPALQPEGDLRLTITGLPGMVQTLTQKGIIDPKMMNVINLAVMIPNALQGNNDPATQNAINIDLHLKDRIVYLGPFKMGQVPKIDWPGQIPVYKTDTEIEP